MRNEVKPSCSSAVGRRSAAGIVLFTPLLVRRMSPSKGATTLSHYGTVRASKDDVAAHRTRCIKPESPQKGAIPSDIRVQLLAKRDITFEPRHGAWYRAILLCGGRKP